MEENIITEFSEQEDIVTSEVSAEPDLSEDSNERREYDELIRNKYKKFYTEDTQKMINRRFRKYKELEARVQMLESEREQFEKTLALEKEKSATEAQNKLLADIRSRHLRPDENGIASQSSPSKRNVSSLTRSERADMARRASRGENVKI